MIDDAPKETKINKPVETIVVTQNAETLDKNLVENSKKNTEVEEYTRVLKEKELESKKLEDKEVEK